MSIKEGDRMFKKAGRIKIFTDQKEINKDNVLPVLRKSYAKHRINASDTQYLFDYESGVQPLPYQKIIRPEISIETTDNMANYVTEFHKGYFWGTPAIYTQRGNQEHHNTNADTDSLGISALNEMMLNGICIGKENQMLADFVEKSGIGHRIVDVKTDWSDEIHQGTYVNVHTLDSRNAFCVYYAGIGQPKVLGVTYTKISGRLYYTCFTKTKRFEIQGNEVVEYINPLGMIPIVEYERAVDRSGCFERQINIMDNLNSMVSNFANDVAQKTQEIWWGNDIEFPVNEKTGEPIKPKSGQWLLTHSDSSGGTNQKIQPMSSTFDSSPTLNAITDTRNEILKQCFVPMQYSSEGGGSTGIASSLSSGWDATAVDADRKQQLIEGAAREELALILKAISLVDKERLPEDDPLRKVHCTDIDIKFTRRQNWDIATKANAYATLVSHGVHGRHALKATNMFDDVEQVYMDSKNGIEQYQQNTYGEEKIDSQTENDRIMQDSSDQADNSPFVNGSEITNSKQVV